MTVAQGSVDDVVRQVRRGGIVCFPTETLWSLSCLPMPDPVERLRAMKGRPEEVAFAVGFASWEAACHFIDPTRGARALAERFLPGPLSIVVKRRSPALAIVAPGLRTVSVRVPDHPAAQAILQATGPLVMTSANRHGDPDPLTLEDVSSSLGDVDLVAAGAGPVPGTASTVVDATQRTPRVLREGVIPKAEVLAAWP